MKIKLSYLLVGIIFLILTKSISYSHTDHYKNLKMIEMDIYRNGKIIGFSKYEFVNYENKLEVINNTEFEVIVLGVKLFSIKSLSKEKYENDQLVEFNSETLQNNKKKFVNLNYDKTQDIFNIVGSSYKGTANKDNVVGNWWNHKILTTNSQISPLSGSVKEQEVAFVSKETISLGGKTFEVDHFKLKSTDDSLEADKKLDFDIWVAIKENIILKVEYNRLGKWQYIIKNIEKYPID